MEKLILMEILKFQLQCTVGKKMITVTFSVSNIPDVWTKNKKQNQNLITFLNAKDIYFRSRDVAIS